MSVLNCCGEVPPRPTAPFNEEPGFYESAGLWLYGNVRLFEARLGYVAPALGPNAPLPRDLDEIERLTEKLVLDGRVLVCGIHNAAHQRAAVVPLRWGSPRIVVVSGGFHFHLGESLDQEPFRAARLWRHQWDPQTDLIVSRRAPHKKPTYASHNPTVNRLVASIANGARIGVLSPQESRQILA